MTCKDVFVALDDLSVFFADYLVFLIVVLLFHDGDLVTQIV